MKTATYEEEDDLVPLKTVIRREERKRRKLCDDMVKAARDAIAKAPRPSRDVERDMCKLLSYAMCLRASYALRRDMSVE